MNMIKNIKFMLRYPMKYIRIEFIFFIILEMLQHPYHGLNGILLEVVFVKVVVDAVQYNMNFETIMYVVAAFTLYFIVFRFIYNFYIDVVWEKALQKMNYMTQLELIDAARKIDIKCFDDKSFYDSCMKSVSVFESKLQDTINHFRLIFCMVLRFIFVVSLLSYINIYVMLLVVVSCGFSIFLNTKINKINYNKYIDDIKYEKKSNYIKRVFNSYDSAKDLKIYDKFSDLMINEYHTQNTGKKEVVKKYRKLLFVFYMLIDYLLGIFVFQGIVILIIAYQVLVTKTIPYSSFAVIIPSIFDLNDSMNWLGNIIPQFKTLSYYIEHIKEFLNYKSSLRTPQSKQPAQPMPDTPQSIELRNVSFSYDNKVILKNISLKIQPGEKIAVVGQNGAGKSTLIKLIMRLYDPQEGEILLNNINIKEYDIDQYYSYFSTVFQDYKIFAVDISENILADNVTNEDEDTIKNAAKLSGFDKVLKSSNGNFTSQISKEFHKDGLILSGGEMQKLAISRVFTGKHPVLILDEPSSSLDPISEAEINQTLLSHCTDNIVIFISHRLSTTKMADRIIVISDGEIIEHGSHQELMGLCGKYAEMFMLQAKNYR